MVRTWNFTVLREMYSRVAIWSLSIPSARSSSTSRWRGLSCASGLDSRRLTDLAQPAGREHGVAGADLGHRRDELRAAGAGEHHAVEVAVAGGHAQRLVDRVGDDDHAHAGRGGPDALERDERAADGMKAGVEDEHVRRAVGELAQQRLGVARRGHDGQAEVVEKPAEGLGQHGTLVGYD